MLAFTLPTTGVGPGACPLLVWPRVCATVGKVVLMHMFLAFMHSGFPGTIVREYLCPLLGGLQEGSRLGAASVHGWAHAVIPVGQAASVTNK